MSFIHVLLIKNALNYIFPDAYLTIFSSLKSFCEAYIISSNIVKIAECLR